MTLVEKIEAAIRGGVIPQGGGFDVDPLCARLILHIIREHATSEKALKQAARAQWDQFDPKDTPLRAAILAALED